MLKNIAESTFRFEIAVSINGRKRLKCSMFNVQCSMFDEGEEKVLYWNLSMTKNLFAKY